MPDWARLQLVLGAAVSGGVFAHGVWRNRPTLDLLAELVSGACCAALFLAYWDIRINAALGGWVIPLFMFVILREGRYALGALRTEASTEVSPDNPLPQWIRYSIEALRGVFWVVPAIYLGGLLTYLVVRGTAQGFGFTIPTLYPWIWVPFVALFALVIAVIAAIAPGRRASRLEVVAALQYE